MSARPKACGLTVLALCAAAALAPSAHAGDPPDPPVAYQPGDPIWSFDPAPLVRAASALTALDACSRLPATGYIAPGAQASTSTRYSSTWDWSAGSSLQPFTWWLYTGGG